MHKAKSFFGSRRQGWFVVLGLLAMSISAQAHPGHLGDSGFTSGFAHPVSGLDHMMAMFAVGLWAAQLGGRATWIVPSAFVSLMTLGGALGWCGVPLPFVEAAIRCAGGAIVAGGVWLCFA